MIKLKKLSLKYYCGYKNIDLDFTDGGNLKQLICFYGPNGIGKSNILRSIGAISDAYRYFGRDISMLFRKSIYHHNYDPSYSSFYNGQINDLYMKGIY
ncbi:MAG: hypothetical protein ACOC5T_04905, partial [Elusimicrobiota bacterium]